METTLTNTTNTLTTAAAWRTAINLTLADVRRWLLIAKDALFALLILAYIMTALCLCVNESDTLLPNALGFLMFFVPYLYVNREKKSDVK